MCVCGGGGDQLQIKRTHEPIYGKRNHSLIYTGQFYTLMQYTQVHTCTQCTYTLYNVHTIHTHTHTVNPLLSHFCEPPSSLVSKPHPLNSLSLPLSTNILLDDHCVPKLSDFGLARELQAKPNQRSSYSTQSNVVMGTLANMAPEFLRNRKMTTKTDVYSFGVVLLGLFTGLVADDPTLKQWTLVRGVAI